MDLQTINELIVMKAKADSINKEIAEMKQDRKYKCDELDMSNGEYYQHANDVALGRAIDGLDVKIKEKDQELFEIQPVLDSYKQAINTKQATLYGKYYANNQILTAIEGEINSIHAEIEDVIYHYAELYYSFDDSFDLKDMDKDIITRYAKDNSRDYEELIVRKEDAERRYSAVEKIKGVVKYNINKINSLEYEVFGAITPKQEIVSDIKSQAIDVLKKEVIKIPNNNYSNLENSLNQTCDELCSKK